jgi:3-oxoacyl-[acyl-carrier-protein] synthase II
VSAAIVAFGARSGLGRGRAAFAVGVPGDVAKVAIRRDAELESAGFARPFAARAHVAGGGDRATALLAEALGDCFEALDERLPSWRSARVGLALGTSSGGMLAAETFFARLDGAAPSSAAEAARATYFAPMLDAVARVLGPGRALAPATLVLGACASSAIAIGLATRWLAEGACDLAIAGGFDAVSTFVASGFEALRATSATAPRPFRVGRDGMALGEGAAVVALVPTDTNGVKGSLGYVTGFGATSDAVHITAPDRTGDGLARAARAALDEQGNPRVDLVSAHATATPFNDAAEARAIAQVGALDAVVHPFKAQIGHTLGAAGALESLAALDALARGVLPAAAGEGAIDDDARVRLLDRAMAGDARVALKLASAFGGANAALVLARDAASSRRACHDSPWITRAAWVRALPAPESMATSLGAPLDRLARCDGAALWALAAIDALVARVGRDALKGAGVVVGATIATLETNATFAARLREKGARFVEPRRFPYTSPNAAAGECSLAFGLRGPSFAVGAGLHAAVEALVTAVTLVRAGDAERIVVVAADDVGPAVHAWSRATGVPLTPGAVALLVTRDRIDASVARVARARTTLETLEATLASRPPEPAGHLALAVLDALAPPSALAAESLVLGTRAVAELELAPI